MYLYSIELISYHVIIYLSHNVPCIETETMRRREAPLYYSRANREPVCSAAF